MLTYRRLFTQPKRLAVLRAEFDAAVHEGSANGTNPELLEVLQGHASKITKLMNSHWDTVIDGTEPWVRMRTRRGEELADSLRELFLAYIDKTTHWLDYFVLDPRWLNLTAVNYAANAAREAASEVRDARIKFEEEYELTRDDLAGKNSSTTPAPAATASTEIETPVTANDEAEEGAA